MFKERKHMKTSQKVMGHVYAIFTILVWGSCFVLTKELLKGYTAIQIIPLRMGLAYVALWALRPRTLKLPWKDELMFILIGITGGSFYFFLQNTALTYTYAANVSIIVALSPILTVILAQLFSRSGERLGKYVYIGAAIAIAGVVLVVLNGQMSFHLNPLGDLIALAAALMWAVYSILIKKYTEQYDNFLVTRRVMLWAFLTSLPLMLLTDGMPDLRPLFTTPSMLLSWLFLGVFGNAVCFAIWNIACHHQQLPVRLPLRHAGGGLPAAGRADHRHERGGRRTYHRRRHCGSEKACRRKSGGCVTSPPDKNPPPCVCTEGGVIVLFLP